MGSRDSAGLRPLALVIAALLAVLPILAHAQNGAPPGHGFVEPTEGEVEALLEDSGLPDLPGGGQDSDAAADERLEEMSLELLREAAALRDHPLDVNSAPLSSLLRLPLLDAVAAAHIVLSREQDGPYASLEDLSRRGVLPTGVLDRLRPYLRVGEPDPPPVAERAPPPTPPATAWSLRLRSSFDADEGTAGLGAGVATYGRLRLSHRERVTVGVSSEKDPGETSALDHVAFFGRWDVGGAGRASGPPAAGADGPSAAAPARLSLGLGDFVGRWGQGLLMSSGSFATPVSYPLGSDRLKGYDGAGECVARRGCFAEAGRGAVAALLVVAETRLDAALAEDGAVSSVRTSGVHVTEGERAGRDALRESLLGARVSYARASWFRAAASVQHFRFDPGLGAADPERQRFRFEGEELILYGADVLADLGPWRLGAEGARTPLGATAGLVAAAARVGAACLSLGMGGASRDYWAPLGGGFPGCSGGTNGTSGWLRIAYGEAGTWKGWFESTVFRRPWRGYLSGLPDGASTFGVGLDVALGRYGRVVLDRRERIATTEEGEDHATSTERSRRTTLSWRTKGSPSMLVTALRVESELGGFEAGRLRALGVRFEREVAGRVFLSVGATAAVERGDAGGAMSYEPGLPGEMSLRSLNGSGTRWYIRGRASLGGPVGLTARLSGGPERGRVEFGVALDVSQGAPG